MAVKKNTHSLSQKEIVKQTTKRLKKYKNLNYFEQYSMFMGVSQLLEIGLKNLIFNKYSYELDKIEKWTLGRITNELEKNKFRQDFIILLRSLVNYRNYIAHELLANELLSHILYKKLKPKKHYSKELRQLHKGIYELEQLMFLFTWTHQNNCWD
jgi:hypothetical protein